MMPVRLRVALLIIIVGLVLAGCVANPERSSSRAGLTGVEWVVETIADRGIIDASHVTLEFTPDGRLGGHATCNRYRADFQGTGSRLSIGPIATTRMACPPALANQERRFLRLLGDASGYDIDANGKLIVHGRSGATIEAYPAR